MLERKKFEISTLTDVVSDISEKLESTVDAYLIGGFAMIQHGAKVSTKDIDVVFGSAASKDRFESVLFEMGFEKVKVFSGPYEKMEASAILQGPGGMRFDVFVKVVCNCLSLTDGMKERARLLSLEGNLNMHVLSREDIFLFKSVTGRDDDLADMAALSGYGLDWDVIDEELKNQDDHWHWLTHHYVKLTELERVHGVASPLIGRLRRDAEIAAGIAVLLPHLKDSLNVVYASQLMKDDEEFSSAVLEKMVELGLAEKRQYSYYPK